MSEVSRSQPKMDELMTELRRHQAEYAELIHGPLCGQAADRIEELEGALQFIADGYENHNINHVDYRVKVYQVATEVLQPKAGS